MRRACARIAVIVTYMQGAPRDLSPFEHGFSWVGLRGVVGFDFAFLGGALPAVPSMLGGRVEAFGLLPGNRIFALQGAQPLLRKKPQ